MNKLSPLSILFLFTIVFLVACSSDKDKADTIIHNANLYTVDSTVTGDYVAIKDGKILAVGFKDFDQYKGANTSMIDAKGKFVMPGFIEGHGHFSGIGYGLIRLNLMNTKSWSEIVKLVEERVKSAKPGEWIDGRGWHQEKWDSIPLQNVLGYPYHDALSAISPNNPVILTHASGHSLFANDAAMNAAGISKETADPQGGLIVRGEKGRALGVFEERAMSNIRRAYGAYLDSLDEQLLIDEWYKAIGEAQKECARYGITSFQDAGSKYPELERYEQMAKDGKLDVRLWVMARHSAKDLEGKIVQYKKIGVGNDFYTCNAIKSEVDGALGSYGAWLLSAYSDKPGFVGQNTTDMYEVKAIADIAMKNDMQFCVHAIGDKANRVVIDIYDGVMTQNADKKDLRWRIEHAQHLDTADIPRFKTLGIIASMQGIHCTSDAPFVAKRLGVERAKKGAYAWRSLLNEGVVIANGTDAPVEDLDPIKSFYASVTRKREDNGLEFFVEQKMNRVEAIYSYTLGNAFAAFEEKIKGSITPGKYADLVILTEDLVKCSDDDILNAKVITTMVDGKIKYTSN
jgi:hypothetical protein